MDNEMIERVATAITERRTCREYNSIELAIAAIKAMREPTEKMIEAGLNCYMDCSNEEVWKAYINAIIGDIAISNNPIIENNL